MELKGSRTEANLLTALKGEALARTKYSLYAAAARKAGYEDIAERFERLSQNEMMHAKFWFERLYGEPGDVRANLMEAASGELMEWKEMYPSFAEEARSEGFADLAAMFESVARIERDHENQFMKMLLELSAAQKSVEGAADDGEVSRRPVPQVEERQVKTGYRCLFCGAVFPAKPDVCSVCHAIGSFEFCTYEL